MLFQRKILGDALRRLLLGIHFGLCIRLHVEFESIECVVSFSIF